MAGIIANKEGGHSIDLNMSINDATKILDYPDGLSANTEHNNCNPLLAHLSNVAVGDQKDPLVEKYQFPNIQYVDKSPVLPFMKNSYAKNDSKQNLTRYGNLSHNLHRREISLNENESMHRDYCCRSMSRQVEQSKPLPRRVQIFLSTIFGVKAADSDKCVVAKFLFAVTVLLGLCNIVLYSWYKIDDVKNRHTNSTVLTGFSDIILTCIWVSLSIYAHRLSSRLFKTEQLMRSVRSHTKTLFKMNAAVLLMLLGVANAGLISYSRYDELKELKCTNMTLNTYVCKIFFPVEIVFTVIGLFWNLIVGFVVLSVARTHTIGLRKFINNLILDACLYERLICLSPIPVQDRRASFVNDSDWFECLEESPQKPALVCLQDPTSEVQYPEPPNADHCNITDIDELSASVMTCEELFFCYWKIACHLRVTSESFQRWLASWIGFIFFWCASFVFYWSTHDITLLRIACFVLPLLILPLLSSAYAEVNSEGTRVPKHIFPTEDRISVLYLICNQPLQMTVFSYPINYSIIMGAIAAMILAFMSKILFNEIMK